MQSVIAAGKMQQVLEVCVFMDEGDLWNLQGSVVSC